MATKVRSYSKINLGLRIGPPRPDGFHGLTTLYQTLALYDCVTVDAVRAPETSLTLTSTDPRVPTDARNTAWKMVERTLRHLDVRAAVTIRIEKRLPIQGGMGAGSANAAAALIGLERELSLEIPGPDRLRLAAEVGSDVPLFLLGGSVLGTDRGQVVEPAPDIALGGQTEIPCVIALPRHGVSTPAAFREWDSRLTKTSPDLHNSPVRDTLNELSRIYASCLFQQGDSESGTSGIFPDPSSPSPGMPSKEQNIPEKLQGLPREQFHGGSHTENRSGLESDLAETLLALVRTGIENDFETVVFAQYPSLLDIKRHLMGSPGSPTEAVYAALSGSGSALFGLYRSQADADVAQQRLQQHGVAALLTRTMPRPLYWSEMFAK